MLGDSTMALPPRPPEHLDIAWTVFSRTHLTQYCHDICKRGLHSDSWMDGYTKASNRECLSTRSISARCHFGSMAEPVTRYCDSSVDECHGASASRHLAEHPETTGSSRRKLGNSGTETRGQTGRSPILRGLSNKGGAGLLSFEKPMEKRTDAPSVGPEL